MRMLIGGEEVGRNGARSDIKILISIKYHPI